MKKYLASTATAALIAGPAAAITIVESDFDGSFDDYNVYEFVIDLGGNSRFEGAFVGADLDNDGVITGGAVGPTPLLDSTNVEIEFPREVPLLRGQYVGPINDLASLGSQDFFFELGGGFFDGELQNDLSFHLDGEGSFGNGNIFRNVETLTLSVPFTESGSQFAIVAGHIPEVVADPLTQITNELFVVTQPCDGIGSCATLFEGFGIEVEDPFEQGEEEPFYIIDYQEVSSGSGTGQILSGPIGDALGAVETAARLPDNTNDDGGFEFEVDLPGTGIRPDQVFFIDPDIAVGYTYGIEGALFSSVQAPSFELVGDDDGYLLTFGGMSVDLAPGELFTFTTPIAEFMITGISEDLMLDPDNPLAFVTGVSVDDTSNPITITQTPMTVFVDDGPAPVPLPAGMWLLLAGLGGLFGIKRRAL